MATPAKPKSSKTSAAGVPASGTAATKPRAPSAALMKPLKPSPELAAIVGAEPLARGQVVSKVWDYIRAHKLQNPDNKREIIADEKLKKVFGRDRCTMFEMNKYLAQHLK